MKRLKKFEAFAAEPDTKPSTSPGTTPTTKPGTSPGEKPSRPNPFRRHKPAVDPKPKAELDDVLELFNDVASDQDKKEISDYYAKKNN